MMKDDNPVIQMIVDHAKTQKNTHDLELVALNTPKPGKPGCYYIHYLANCPLNINEVRQIVVDVTESFIAYSNENPCIQDPISVEEIILNIGFVEEDGSFHEPPSIAYTYLKYGTVHYCYYDNDFGKFISYDDVTEPYHIAKNIVTSTS